MAERRNLTTNEIALEETKMFLKIRTKHQILAKFWQNLQTSLVLLIPNCTRQRMITYTNLY